MRPARVPVIGALAGQVNRGIRLFLKAFTAMTDYETKSLKLLAAIDVKLGLLVTAAGLTVPEEPKREPIKISRSVLDAIGPGSGGSTAWMGR